MIENNIKITSYLKFTCPKKPEERIMHIACCGKVQRGKFCQNCGKEIEVRTYTVQVDAISQYDIADEIKEALRYLCPEDGCDIWHPNDAGVLNEQAIGHHAITEEMIAAEKESIVCRYSEQIAVLTKHYGSQPEVCFGMLVWSA